jgi:hypothetical protein
MMNFIRLVAISKQSAAMGSLTVVLLAWMECYYNFRHLLLPRLGMSNNIFLGTVKPMASMFKRHVMPTVDLSMPLLQPQVGQMILLHSERQVSYRKLLLFQLGSM